MTVRRALPRRTRRTVGAWCFLDHFGPVSSPAGAPAIDIGPHPHIGLQTVTWLLEGDILHRDTLGSRQRIRPGQLNWMTAGRGIAHSEEGHADAATTHGVQLWVALPDAERHCDPAFDHYPELPRLAEGDTALTVLAGSLGGLRSPARCFSPLVAVDIALPEAGRVRLPLEPDFEHAVMAMDGSADAGGHGFGLGELLYVGTGRRHLDLSSDQAARVLLIGGLPLAEPLLLWWNFVGRSHGEMVQARQRWVEGDFGHIDGARSAPMPAPQL